MTEVRSESVTTRDLNVQQIDNEVSINCRGTNRATNVCDQSFRAQSQTLRAAPIHRFSRNSTLSPVRKSKCKGAITKA